MAEAEAQVEAVISMAIQVLENSLAETTDVVLRWAPTATLNELRLMLDYLRSLQLGERSSLKYLIDDVVEMAQDVVGIMRYSFLFGYTEKLNDIQVGINMTKMSMINFGAYGEQTEIKPRTGSPLTQASDFLGPQQNVGEDGDEEEVVVGLEEDMHQLLNKAILNEETCRLTLCIKGMLGVGKTTLAKQVYNHKAVVDRFEHRAWVCLFSGMSNKEVLVELIQQVVVGGEGLERDSLLEKMDNRSLQQILHQHLRGKRYFIVFDNLHKELLLESVLKGLPREGKGSRLLFTSRYRYPIGEIYYTHEMKCLDSNKSWRLFLKTISRGNNFTSDELKFPKHLERKGKEMLKKCGGLPVAIIDVARQKAKQIQSGIEWEELFDSVDLSSSLKLLEVMYHELDPQLKKCFLHMSFFKENAIMREEKLEQIWAARKLNIPRYATHALHCESIIEVVHECPYASEVKRCRLNPLLHSLSIEKAEEEMGFEILRSNGNNRHSQSPRHRVIHCGREKFNHSTSRDKHLVSLIFHGGGGYLDDASPSYWKSLELLNILDMEDFGVKTLSETIGALIELRYVGLRNNYIQEIPHSFGGLKKLEVLDIALNFMVEVPDIIWEMDSLGYLHMSDVICRKHLKVDALQNLVTLTYISIHDWTYEVEGLETMSCLQKLGVEEVDENSNVSKLFASLAKLKRLSRLTLRGFRFRSMPCLDELGVLGGLLQLRLDGLLARLPGVDSFPQRIYYLILVNTCLDEDPMPVLEKLPHLRRLKLRNTYTGRQMVIKRRMFRSLRVLRINELWNLMNVQVGEGAMEKLEQLEIKNSPHLETLPEEIASMANLRKLKMVTTKHIATKIRDSSLVSKIVVVDISP